MKKNIIAFVCIRLNSKRLPRKNLLKLGDKPLCYYACEELLKLKYISKVCVYCSDPDIIKYLPSNVEFVLRDKKYDSDDTLANELLKSFSRLKPADYYILSHTTAPFLKADTIQKGLNKVINGNYDSSFSATRHQTFFWENNKPLNFNIYNIERTQDLKPIYMESVGFYIYSYNEIINNNRRIGDNPWIQIISMEEAIDIDTEEDFNFAKKLISLKNNNIH